jgi:hypothetical protein
MLIREYADFLLVLPMISVLVTFRFLIDDAIAKMLKKVEF